MDIVKALRKEEAKLEKTAKNALKQLTAIREAVKAFGGSLIGGAGRKKRRMSAAGRLAISKATKARWAKFHAAKAGKPRRKMSAAGKRIIAEAQRARWAKIHAKKAKKAA